MKRNVIALLVAVSLAGCSGDNTAPTTTLEATTTTQATTTTSQPATGHDYIPAPIGDCDADLAAVEKVMAAHPLSEIETSAHKDAFAGLLRAATTECRTDVMERWAIETYQPWITGHPITPGRVPTDVNKWPKEWRDARSSGTTQTTTTTPDE